MAKRRTLKEQRKVCRAWQQSGLTQEKFCQQNNVSTKSLYRWLKKFKSETIIDRRGAKDSTKNVPLRFLQIHNPQRPADREKLLLEFILPNGISCKINTTLNSCQILLQGLLKWK